MPIDIESERFERIMNELMNEQTPSSSDLTYAGCAMEQMAEQIERGEAKFDALTNGMVVVQPIVLLCAFRYALGRQTHVSSDLVKALRSNWDRLHESDQDMVRREITKAIEDDHAGAEIDVEEWRKLL